MKETYKPYDIEELVDYYFFRPLASLIVKAVLNTKITPNHLTAAALFFGTLSGVLFHFSEDVSIISGILCLLIYTIFDCSDGQLARKRGTAGATFGRALDGFIDYLVFLSIYLSTVLKFQGIPFLKIEGADPYGWTIWVLGLVAMVSHSIHCSCFDYYQNEYVSYVVKGRRGSGTTSCGIKKEIADLKHVEGKGFVRFVLWGIFFFTVVQEKVNKKKARVDRQEISPDVSELYKQQNRFLLRLWSFLGSSAHIVLIVVFAAVNRMDLFFIFEVTVLNGYLLVLMYLQKRALRNMDEQPPSIATGPH